MLDRFARPGRALAGAAGLLALSAAGCGARSTLGELSASTTSGAGGARTSASSSSSAGGGAAMASSVGVGGSCDDSGVGGAGATGAGGEVGVVGCPGAPFQYEVVAGDGVAGSLGDKGPATQAELGLYPAGMAGDAAGNLYIADPGNSLVRKVDTAGIITAFAGTGQKGFSGDGVPAITADIAGPAGVGVDGAGNVYFAEVDNQDIRRVDAQGVIATFAALQDQPNGIYVAGAGDVWVAMPNLNQILRVSAGGAKTTTVAGSGEQGYSGDCGPAVQARLNGPTGVWVDGKGDLFINDSGNFVVRKVDPSGTIHTFAGNGMESGYGENLPARQAAVPSRYGIAVDAAGEVFISDYEDEAIRMVDTCGIIHSIAGDGLAGTYDLHPGPALARPTWGPGYAWIDAQGAFYFTDIVSAVYRIHR